MKKLHRTYLVTFGHAFTTPMREPLCHLLNVDHGVVFRGESWHNNNEVKTCVGFAAEGPDGWIAGYLKAWGMADEYGHFAALATDRRRDSFEPGWRSEVPHGWTPLPTPAEMGPGSFGWTTSACPDPGTLLHWLVKHPTLSDLGGIDHMDAMFGHMLWTVLRAVTDPDRRAEAVDAIRGGDYETVTCMARNDNDLADRDDRGPGTPPSFELHPDFPAWPTLPATPQDAEPPPR